MNSRKESPVNAASCAAALIEHFKMQKIPHEGAWFAPNYRSPDEVGRMGSQSANATHRVYSAIYGVITPHDFSAFHRLATDEVWHYYGGDALEMLLLHPDGRGETILIGPDVFSGQRPQFLVPAGVWQGSRPLDGRDNAYTFFGATMAPGFEFSDYEPGCRQALQTRYPHFAAKIASLTRESHPRPGW